MKQKKNRVKSSKKSKKEGFFSLVKKMPKEYLLSHHPTCKEFEEHTFSLFGKKFCIGCFIGYPSAIIGIIIATELLQISDDYSKSVFWVGMAFPSTIFLSFTPLTEKKTIKIIQKVLIGFGAGFLLTFIYYMPTQNKVLNFVVVFLLATSLNLILNIIHYRNHNKICSQCEYEPQTNKCSGLRTNPTENKPTSK